MSVQADPQKLKYGANRFAAGSQELRSKRRRLEEISQNVLRGQYGWTGQGARAFEQIGEQLGREMDQATDVLQRAATVMQTFGYRMEQVNQLRDQAERLERQLWHIDTSTPEGRHEASDLRHRMHDLNNRAEHEARIADQQAARGFDELAESAFLRNFADPSWWDRFVGGVKEGAGVVGSFFQGMGDAVVDTAEGIWHVVTHPIDTLEGLISSLSHPIDTWNAIKTAVIDSWEKDVVNGDADSRAKWFGYAIGQVALSLVSTKGADKAVKVVRSVAKPKTAHAAKASDLATDGRMQGVRQKPQLYLIKRFQ